MTGFSALSELRFFAPEETRKIGKGCAMDELTLSMSPEDPGPPRQQGSAWGSFQLVEKVLRRPTRRYIVVRMLCTGSARQSIIFFS